MKNVLLENVQWLYCDQSCFSLCVRSVTNEHISAGLPTERIAERWFRAVVAGIPHATLPSHHLRDSLVLKRKSRDTSIYTPSSVHLLVLVSAGRQLDARVATLRSPRSFIIVFTQCVTVRVGTQRGADDNREKLKITKGADPGLSPPTGIRQSYLYRADKRKYFSCDYSKTISARAWIYFQSW